MFDIAIKGGTVVTEMNTYPADVGIEDGTIAHVSQRGVLPPARQEIDAEGMLILPGAIDIHFHVRAPGHAERGTFASETQAAAGGGVTTLLEMPISIPACARLDIFENRKALGLSQAYTNFGLYGAAGLLDRDEILNMADAGACGFKIFTHAAPPGREDEFLGICLPDEDKIYEALELIKETRLLASFHAENERLIQLFEGRIRKTERVDPAAYVESRPPVIEAMSVSQLAVLCEELNTHVHIAHVSAAWPLRILQEAQSRGVPMTGETCPHYLQFTARDVEEHGPFAKIKPPFRTKADQDALWAGLVDGTLSAITTDHSPYTLSEKERGIDDIWAATIGAPSVEALVSFVMTEALDARITVEQAVQFLSSQPARLFNLYPEKGTIQPDADADLLIYDPRGTHVIDSSQWFTKARDIDRLYNGQVRRGRIRTTIVGGTVVFDDGQIVVDEPVGSFVRPNREG